MAKKKRLIDEMDGWTKAIKNMKTKVEIYYERDDIEMLQPYKISGVANHFDSGEEYVQFHSIRTENPSKFILQKDDFVKRFRQVTEEY